MTGEKQQLLFDRYPGIFRERTLGMTRTGMCWGICCEDGWFDLLDLLCACLVELERAAELEVVAKQVKEKFGGLRFYYEVRIPERLEQQDNDIWKIIIDSVVTVACQSSLQVCEITGQTGSLYVKDGWYKTLSPEKAKELRYI